jgi:hypothetical protein
MNCAKAGVLVDDSEIAQAVRAMGLKHDKQ